jgi:hypothetical protein
VAGEPPWPTRQWLERGLLLRALIAKPGAGGLPFFISCFSTTSTTIFFSSSEISNLPEISENGRFNWRSNHDDGMTYLQEEQSNIIFMWLLT